MQMVHRGRCVHPAPSDLDRTATIVWKLTPNGWNEARWHVSILCADQREALAAATGRRVLKLRRSSPTGITSRVPGGPAGPPPDRFRFDSRLANSAGHHTDDVGQLGDHMVEFEVQGWVLTSRVVPARRDAVPVSTGHVGREAVADHHGR